MACTKLDWFNIFITELEKTIRSEVANMVYDNKYLD